MKTARRNAPIHGLEGIPGDVRRRPYRRVELLAHRVSSGGHRRPEFLGTAYAATPE
jgi:hypothetical protein